VTTPARASDDAGRNDLVHLHLDPLGGLSGDMFLAAVVDAWPELFEGTVSAMRAAGLPADWAVDRLQAIDHGLSGSRFVIAPPAAGRSRPTGSFREIRARLEASPLEAGVRGRAVEIFGHLAAAEARVHGGHPEDVHFHEIADWDSVADIVGAAYLIGRMGTARWSVGPLPLGSGRVVTEHGPLPVPAPATVHLLEGLAVIDDGVGGERVTPTGAAILRALDPLSRPPSRALEIAAGGYGFGTRTLPGVANALRILAFTAARTTPTREEIGVIRFEVDDQTPEDLATGLARISALAAVRDVIQWPVYGKKGRLAVAVQVLCDPAALDPVARSCLEETTTIGLRRRVDERTVLPRISRTVEVAGGAVAVKEVLRPGGRRTVKAEADEIAGRAETEAERSALRRRVEDLAREDSDA
jgi:uncharacterized protein (TIGR00299 family) protein